MPNEARPRRLAVLIDADNTSARIAEGLFEEIATIGEASVRRIYGDFASPHMKAWNELLARYAIVPQQQFAYVKGKNASDITLVIDAMDGHVRAGRFRPGRGLAPRGSGPNLEGVSHHERRF